MTKIDNMAELTVSTSNLTVLILAAGYGRRMGQFTRMVNKSLIPYKDKPLISHIIDKFPKNSTKFVIACGHMGQQVKDYVSSVHDDKQIVFVDIPNYSESNTGPATTVRYCTEHIKGRFVLVACDTLFEFNWQNHTDHNWIGVYPVDSVIAKDYDWVERDGNDIVSLHNKKTSDTAVDAFIGLMYNKDDSFLNYLEERDAKENYQGFSGMDLKAYTVRKWLDFGTYEKWYTLNSQVVENSFVKPDELFYHDNNKIIKYFTNKDNVISRVQRAEANPSCMPSNIKAVGNFLVHDYSLGDIVYNQATPELFKEMLSWCESNLWVNAPVSVPFDNIDTCRKFYKNKTYERLDQFRVKYADWSECKSVNGVEVESINSYLDSIDWDWLCTTNEWRFIHGDLHFDNTIFDPNQKKFTAIDWRTDFAGKIYGDIYYDLAKMLGGIILNYRKVKDNDLEYIEKDNRAEINIPHVDNYHLYEEILKEWVIAQGLSWSKVKLLVPIIYLNMSPLHEAPFDKFLIALSQLQFKLGTK
jgi:NDP-sugar pyrophosphorylase family protein